jgi:hypothetical protein
LRNYATHIALLVQLGNKQRIHGKVTDGSAVALLIKITSKFAILYITMYVIMGRLLFKIFQYFSSYFHLSVASEFFMGPSTRESLRFGCMVLNYHHYNDQCFNTNLLDHL